MNYGHPAYYAGRAEPYVPQAQKQPFDPSQLFALHSRIMNAPLSDEEKKIVEQSKDKFTAIGPFVGAAVTAGLTTLIGLAVGSERHGRNAAIGALLGFGVGTVAQVAKVANVSSQISQLRSAKYAAESQRLLSQG